MSKIENRKYTRRTIACSYCGFSDLLKGKEDSFEYDHHIDFDKTCVVCEKEGCTRCMKQLELRGISFYYHVGCYVTSVKLEELDKRAEHSNDARERAWNAEYNCGRDCS